MKRFKFIQFILFFCIHMALLFYFVNLHYYRNPVYKVIEEKIPITDYDARYVHKMENIDKKKYFFLYKIEQVEQTDGLFIRTIMKDTIDSGIYQCNK